MPLAREEILARMRQLPERIARIVQPLSIEALTRAGAGGQWGAVEILAHLRDCDEINIERVERILTEDQPTLETYDSDLWAIERDYQSQDPIEILASFRALRGELVDSLQGLSPEQWSRTARHPDLGTITLADLVRTIDEHDQRHFQDLKDVLL